MVFVIHRNIKKKVKFMYYFMVWAEVKHFHQHPRMNEVEHFFFSVVVPNRQ